MKKIFFACFGIAALTSGSALAADMGLPYKAPPPPPPTWTGCYINGGAGYGMANLEHHAETFPGLFALDVDTTSGGRGWYGVAGAGCDYQFNLSSWNVVIGGFGDYNFMDLYGTVADPATGLQGKATEQGAWAGGVRAGVLITPTLLTYINGGYTGAQVGQVNLFTSGIPPIATGLATPQRNLTGWFIGGGTEYALNWDWMPIRGLFWRNEYRWSYFNADDNQVIVAATGAATGLGVHSQLTTQTISTELVWRFNWTGR